MAALPQTQYAVQLVGADGLILNTSKEVVPPGRRQILCVVEAVGLCFSDLKLLKLFSSHVRKGEIIGGGVKNFKPGERYLVQTDYRWLRTVGSNAEGGVGVR